MGMTRILVIAAVIGIAGIFVFNAVAPTGPDPAVTLSATDRRECPIDTTFIDSISGPAAEVTEIAVSKQISHIPEFHDCQRFVKDGAFGELYAIFASFDLKAVGRSINRQPTTTGVTPAPNTGGMLGTGSGSTGTGSTGTTGGASTSSSVQVTSARTFGEIYSWHGTYGELGIEPGFNCLYMYQVGGAWQARMIPATQRDTSCLNVINRPDTLTRGKALKVIPHPAIDGIAGADYPAVARWDWDQAHGKHYIGILCDTLWCEVGDTDLTPSPDLDNGPGFDEIEGETVTEAASLSVWKVKGWYDRQRLASWTGGPIAVPSTVWGYIIPHPALGTLDNSSDFAGRWVHSANVMVSSNYTSSFVRFKKGRNRIYVCHGTAAECKVKGPAPSCQGGVAGTWWAKVKPPSFLGIFPRKAWFRCVSQTDHSTEAAADGFRIPGTARWRWLAADETTWNRCTEGCCEIQ